MKRRRHLTQRDAGTRKARHREQRTYQLARRGVTEHPHHGERATTRSLCQPGRLHIDRDGAAFAQPHAGPPHRRARNCANRPSPHAQPTRLDRGGQLPSVGTRDLRTIGGEHAVCHNHFAHLAVLHQPSAKAEHEQNLPWICEQCGNSPARTARAHPGPMDASRRTPTTDQVGLEPQRGRDQQSAPAHCSLSAGCCSITRRGLRSAPASTNARSRADSETGAASALSGRFSMCESRRRQLPIVAFT